MCRNCTRYAINKRDPKSLLGAAEVKHQMNALKFNKGLLAAKLKAVDKKIETLREKCPHLTTKIYSGYDDDTEECQDCGYSW